MVSNKCSRNYKSWKKKNDCTVNSKSLGVFQVFRNSYLNFLFCVNVRTQKIHEITPYLTCLMWIEDSLGWPLKLLCSSHLWFSLKSEPRPSDMKKQLRFYPLLTVKFSWRILMYKSIQEWSSKNFGVCFQKNISNAMKELVTNNRTVFHQQDSFLGNIFVLNTADGKMAEQCFDIIIPFQLLYVQYFRLKYYILTLSKQYDIAEHLYLKYYSALNF